jgi:hypothetical protein
MINPRLYSILTVLSVCLMAMITVSSVKAYAQCGEAVPSSGFEVPPCIADGLMSPANCNGGWSLQYSGVINGGQVTIGDTSQAHTGNASASVVTSGPCFLGSGCSYYVHSPSWCFGDNVTFWIYGLLADNPQFGLVSQSYLNGYVNNGTDSYYLFRYNTSTPNIWNSWTQKVFYLTQGFSGQNVTFNMEIESGYGNATAVYFDDFVPQTTTTIPATTTTVPSCTFLSVDGINQAYGVVGIPIAILIGFMDIIFCVPVLLALTVIVALAGYYYLRWKGIFK